LAFGVADVGVESMKRLERYLFRNAAMASLITMMGLGGMIWVSQAIRQLDLVTGKGQTLFLFLQATLLIIPQLALIVTPIAVFVGIIFTLNRLNADSELVVMSSAGLRPLQIARPFALLALLAALFCALLSTEILPNSARALREIVTKVRADVITRILEEGRFVELDGQVVFHYRSKAKDGALEGVLMQDRRQKDLISTYLAERGVITQIDGADYLVLSNGSLQRQSPKGDNDAIVTFVQYAFDLEGLSGGQAKVFYFPRERSTLELLSVSPENARVAQEEGRIRAELHDRFSSPLFAFAAAGIAFAALGTARTTRQGRGLTILAAVIVLIVARSAAFGAFTLAGSSRFGVILMYALPIGVTIGSLVVAFWPGTRRNRIGQAPALVVTA
jgi:lipopolysaccharide export system permease protein